MRERMSRRKFMTGALAAAAAAGLGGRGPWIAADPGRKDFDLIVKGGLVYDGTGAPGFLSDVAIRDGVMVKVGTLLEERAVSVIEAKGLAVCPGFIDLHAHTDIELLIDPRAESAVRQGITTIISGNCGSSGCLVPDAVFEETAAGLKEVYGLELTWRDLEGFQERLLRSGTALNYVTLTGHGGIRGAAMGFADRPPTEAELEKMKRLLRESLRAGAAGLSSGLEYTPGSFARTEELTALCRVVAEAGGVYATHMRDEGDRLLESLEESVTVAAESGVSLQISHFKTAYPRNWPKLGRALARVEEASRRGVKIFCDRYPYIAGATDLSFYFPLWIREGTTGDFLGRLREGYREVEVREHLAAAERRLGSWDKVVISDVVSAGNKTAEGRSVLEASRAAGKEPYDFMRDLLLQEKGRVGIVIFMMNEDNPKKILAHPLVGVGTDGSALAPSGPLGKGKPHPRHYGTFPRVLGRYVREEKILPPETMIKKMTSTAAEKFVLKRRGKVAAGFFADLVVFDPDKVADRATWTDPHRFPEGIEYVLVNGRVVVDRGEHTGRLPGRILKPLSDKEAAV
ncbi:MAG: D-aminoacylase [Candidatus Aminicenantes bacterium]|nr:D-aminoacylase [Candidatus Aminicenantes bacterium]